MRNKFGTFGGVFTPCILTILGVIMYMRAGFVVGHGGILGTVVILLLAQSITLLTALSTSAIGTNMEVRGGGAYYLISRVLGPEYGGSIGLMLFLAQAVSVPFYILGFTEALVKNFPAMEPYYGPIALTTAAVLFVITYIGASWAIRIQYLIMAIVFSSIFVFLGGALLRFSPETFGANLLAPARGEAGMPQANYPFWGLFAIYFPAVTGIMAGINMSGDLENPARSLPRGTLYAIGVGLVIYALQIVICGGSIPRSELIEQPYLSLKAHALWNMGWLVTAGMFAASLSSAIGSFMGAPRVLQAVARDGILPAKALAKGTQKGDEPRNALLVAAVLTFAVIIWAINSTGGNAFNIVAKVITLFFLYTYGMLNISAFIEAASGNPSFRPKFRFFHWSTALLGALGCIAVAFVIAPVEAVVAFGILALFIHYIKKRQLEATFGDARRGYRYRHIRRELFRLQEMPESAKNWRPTCLVFSGNPETRETLVNYAVWMESGRGLVFLVQILVGTLEEYLPRRQVAIDRLQEFCKNRSITAFPVVVIDEDLESGMENVLQTTCIGPIKPNLALFGWAGVIGGNTNLPVLFHTAQALGMATCVVRPGQRIWRQGHKQIDVWWRGMKNGGLMILLAHLLRRNWEWSRATIRLIRMVAHDAGAETSERDLEKLLHDARVDATVKVVVSTAPFPEVFRRESEETDLVFLGFELPEEGQQEAWVHHYELLLEGGPDAILICSAGGEDILA